VRVLPASVLVAALVAAVWLGGLGRHQAQTSSHLRAENATAVARNRTLTTQLHATTAANTRTQARVAQIDGDGQAVVDNMDALVRAWNEWLDSSNALVGASNHLIDATLPSPSVVRASLGLRVVAVNVKEAEFEAEIMKFSAAATKARQDLSGARQP